MSQLETFYLKCPWQIQNILVSIEGWRIKQRRYGKTFADRLKKSYLQAGLKDENLSFFQDNCLRQFLKIACQSPFWKKRFEDYNIDVQKEGIFSEFLKLPILTKEEVKSSVQQFRSPETFSQRLVSCHTSGTTGSGLIFPSTVEAEHAQWATWWRYRSWHGIEPGTWCGYFGGRSLVPLNQTMPPFWRINKPGRQLMFSVYHLSELNAKYYVQKLKDDGIEWLHGYPSSISLLAKFKIEQNLSDLPSLRIITTGAESLLPHQRRVIEEAFSVPVREHYGQAEGVANISECPDGYLHVDEDYSYVEFVPAGKNDDTYRIIGTNWTNSAFPLLRYDTGDLATLSNVSCCCGRPGRIVKQIDGRVEDFVVLPNGVKIGRLDHIFKDLTTIHEAQIYQDSKDSLCFRIVPGEDYVIVRDENLLLDEARARLGHAISLSIEYVDCLPREKSGKLRFVVSDLKEGKLSA